MSIKKSSLLGFLTFAFVIAVLFTACNENAKSKETIVVDSTTLKKTERLIDTTAESRPLAPGG